ncbi:uncharacterized protein LOC118274841 isoform X5 [Spodoptera frugiperda]|uniref:Uncharacterized protein LOC118274841 isoform X5 n=1 Tax=Spodoptera frugiperda TaxID=7108 RepID=A0A9R0DUC9_SPOFR|nr:uncharacterized protein LOC118274841 isoform X5 [Spodoptera frugiperda]
MKKMVIGIKIAVLILLVIISVSYEQDTPVYPSPCPRIYEYEPPETEPDLWSAVVLISTDSLLYYLWLNIVLDRPALHLRNPIGKVVTKNNIDFRIESDIRVFPGQPIPLRFSIKYDPTNGVPKLKAIRLNGKVICKDDTLENTAIKPAKIMEETTVSTTTSATISNINTGPDSNYFMPFEETPIETFKFNKTFLEMTGNLNLPWVQSFGSEVGGVLTTTQRNPWTTMRSDTDEVEDYRGYRVDELHSSETYPNGGDSYFMYNPQGSYTQAPQPGVVEPVQRIIKHPEISLTDNIHRDNVAILELSEPVKYTEWVRRVCLWPRQFTELESVVGKTGWLLGWGFTEKYDVTGNAHAVEMTVLSTEDCVRSNPVARQLIPSNSSKFCAASNADSVCWAASTGSGLYFKLGQRWHVRGAVSHAVKSKDPAKEMLRCDPTQNFIFTDYAKYLPWIRLFTFDL